MLFSHTQQFQTKSNKPTPPTHPPTPFKQDCKSLEAQVLKIVPN